MKYVQLVGGPYDGMKMQYKGELYITIQKRYKSGKVFGCTYKWDDGVYRFHRYKK